MIRFPAEPFPKGDVRRLLTLALAIDSLERATLTTLAAAIGHHKQTIVDDVPKLAQLGVEVEKIGPVYRVTNWGPILKKGALKEFLKGQIA